MENLDLMSIALMRHTTNTSSNKNFIPVIMSTNTSSKEFKWYIANTSQDEDPIFYFNTTGTQLNNKEVCISALPGQYIEIQGNFNPSFSLMVVYFDSDENEIPIPYNRIPLLENYFNISFIVPENAKTIQIDYSERFS